MCDETTVSKTPDGRRSLPALFAAIALLASACADGARDRQATQSRGDYVNQPAPVSNGATATNTSGFAGAPAPNMDYEARRSSADAYARIDENRFLDVDSEPTSTFSVDVDTASYSNTRRFLNEGRLPPRDAVRIEELVNYFPYEYSQPDGVVPFSVNAEVAECPWNAQHRLVHIGLQGRRPAENGAPARNLVFLVDTSGSMASDDKLPLLKRALNLLSRELTARDRIAVVAYAGAAGLVLPSTPGDRTREIVGALDDLQSGGSTAGGAGIVLAYKTAQANFIEGGVNRVILATDGDFNVGVSDTNELKRLIEEKRRGGVSLTVLGVGRGNLNDSMMETLANNGNGNYAYLDSIEEARRVLVDNVGATLETIAKDVKIQVEFNERQVESYRLIGYEDRMLANRDFDDDRKDAGEIGAGHTVTALYEIVPARAAPREAGDVLTLKLRYKEPNGDESKLIQATVRDRGTSLGEASSNLKFAAAVAEFGMLLRGSEHKGTATYRDVLDLASSARSADRDGSRREFVALVERASSLDARR